MSAWIIDAAFAVIIVFAVVIGARRGFFKSISGIAGTVLGFIGAQAFNLSVSSYAEKPAASFFAGLFEKSNIREKLLNALTNLSDKVDSVKESLSDSGMPDYIANLVDGKLKSAEISPDGFAQKCTDGTISDTIGQWAAHTIVPVITFILLFIVIKLAVSLICKLLSANIPVMKGVNRIAGGMLGTLSGLLLVVLLCCGIVLFAPEENVGYINRPVLEESIIGGVVSNLFF